MEKSTAIKILVVEDEPEIRELVSIILGAKFEAVFLEAGTGREAVDIIGKEGASLSLVVCDFNMPQGNGGVVWSYLRDNFPNIPYVLMTSDSREEHMEITDSALFGYVQKPFFDDSLMNEVERLLRLAAVSVSKDPEYAAISVSTLEKIGQITAPLYLRLGDSHFVKVTNENSKFASEDRDKFLKKGAVFLYVETNKFQTIVKDFKTKVFNDMFLTALKNKTVDKKIKLSKNIQELITIAVKTFNWSEEIVELGNKNIQLVQATVDSVPDLCEVFKWFDDNSDEHEYGIYHSILLSYGLTWICRGHNLKRQNALEILTLAAFFHDVALADHQIKNEGRFINAISIKSSVNKSDVEDVKNHPEKAVEMLKAWKTAPEGLMEVILSHHERPDGSGFPRGIKGENMDQLTAAFIVVQDLVEAYLLHRDRALVKRIFEEKYTELNQGATQEFYVKALALL